jgi:MGT family glycosyltransferase
MPWATFSVHTGLIESDDSLPWTLGVARTDTAFGRAKNNVMKWVARRMRCTLDDAANASRARLGLPPLTDALRTTAVSPHMYHLFWPKEIEPPRKEWPPQVQFVGQYIWDEPKGFDAPEWMDDVKRDRPLVYSTIGTTSHRLEIDFFQTLMDALGDEPYDVVVSTGAYEDDYVTSRLPTNIPKNFRIAAFLPNSRMIPQADVVVQHAGAGTTMQCWAAGAPMVGIPMNHECFDIGQRIVESGCGVRIDKDKVTAEQLRKAVARVLREPSFKANAIRVRDELAHYDSKRVCADALLELASRGPNPTPVGPRG